MTRKFVALSKFSTVIPIMLFNKTSKVIYCTHQTWHRASDCQILNSLSSMFCMSNMASVKKAPIIVSKVSIVLRFWRPCGQYLSLHRTRISCKRFLPPILTKIYFIPLKCLFVKSCLWCFCTRHSGYGTLKVWQHLGFGPLEPPLMFCIAS